MPMDQQLLTYPTWERYTVLAAYISRMSVKDRRKIFQMVRRIDHDWHDVVFPDYGFTFSEFAVWYTLSGARKK